VVLVGEYPDSLYGVVADSRGTGTTAPNPELRLELPVPTEGRYFLRRYQSGHKSPFDTVGTLRVCRNRTAGNEVTPGVQYKLAMPPDLASSQDSPVTTLDASKSVEGQALLKSVPADVLDRVT
jgi:hypothetical protein